MYQVITIRNEKNEVVEVGIIDNNYSLNNIPIFNNEKIVTEGIPMSFEDAKRLLENLNALYFK